MVVLKFLVFFWVFSAITSLLTSYRFNLDKYKQISEEYTDDEIYWYILKIAKYNTKEKILIKVLNVVVPVYNLVVVKHIIDNWDEMIHKVSVNCKIIADDYLAMKQIVKNTAEEYNLPEETIWQMIAEKKIVFTEKKED